MKNIELITLLFISFLLGIIVGQNEAKKEAYPNYDLTKLMAKLDSLEAKKDKATNHYETNITNEKNTIIQNFASIDSLTCDSAYQLWTSEARQYRPIFN